MADDLLIDPEPGDVGSWVTLPDGTRGQVWAKVGCRKAGPTDHLARCRHKGCEPARWVANGEAFIEVLLDDITAAAIEGEVALF